MHYLGGKSRLAKKIAAPVVGASVGRRRNIEPFLGGGWARFGRRTVDGWRRAG